MSKEEHVTINISKNAALVLEELAQISGLSQEKIVDYAVRGYYMRTIHHYRALRPDQENEEKDT